MIKEYGKRFSFISLIYLLVTCSILGVIIISSEAGFGVLKEFIIKLVENFDIRITLQSLIKAHDNGRYEFLFFILSMLQVTYISRIISKFVTDGTYIDEIFMLMGSTCLSCFLSIAYSLCPMKLLVSRIGFLFIIIWLGMGWLYGFVKAILGVVRNEWGAYTFVVRFMLRCFINPIMLGMLGVLLPSILCVWLYESLYDAILYKNVILLVVTVVLSSYSLNKLCGKLIDLLLDMVNVSYVYTVDIFYGAFSLALIIGWFALMIFKTDYTDLIFYIDNKKYAYRAIKTVDRGIENGNFWWGYFKDGTLIIDAEYKRMNDYSFDNSPWYKWRDEISRIVILDGTEYIGNCAFCGMNNVEQIYISKDVDEISNMVFLDCELLQAINVDENNSIYSSIDGVLYNKDKTKLLECPEGKKAIIIPETVEEIEETFSDNAALREINVSDKNKSFSSEDGVLYNKLRTKVIRCPLGKKGEYFVDADTKEIASYAFQYCRELQNIVLPDKLEDIGYSAFAGCKKLEKIVIPEAVKKIESNAFMDCASLKEIIFEGNLEEIGENVFLRSNPQIFNLNLPLKKERHTHNSLMENPAVPEEFAADELNENEASSDIHENENADISNKYLEFIGQYAGKAAFYSIQNIKEGKQPILLLASSFENEEDYEVIDDKNIYSKQCDVYDHVDGEIVQLGSISSLSGYLSLYTKDTEDYIATRINTHSIYFTCIKDDKLYTYGYNTNDIVKDIVDYAEDGEYYDYAYGTTNYENAIGEYSVVEEIAFEKISNDKTVVSDETGFDKNNSFTE